MFSCAVLKCKRLAGDGHGAPEIRKAMFNRRPFMTRNKERHNKEPSFSRVYLE